ncbi:hypothetical protein PFISCL1PPCAC_25903, partial [Pristionchus fissidentatus]
KFKMPTQTDSCVQIIHYKVHSDPQATATCRDYFPTNFVKGVIDESDSGKIKCTVDRQFECNFMPGSVTMHDKCYTFSTEEVKIDDYLTRSPEDKYCKKGGKIPVPFSMSQTKYIAMEAHRQGINR